MQADREMRAWCHGALSCLGCVWWSEGMLWYVSTEVQASNMAEYVPKPSPPPTVVLGLREEHKDIHTGP